MLCPNICGQHVQEAAQEWGTRYGNLSACQHITWSITNYCSMTFPLTLLLFLTHKYTLWRLSINLMNSNNTAFVQPLLAVVSSLDGTMFFCYKTGFPVSIMTAKIEISHKIFCYKTGFPLLKHYSKTLDLVSFLKQSRKSRSAYKTDLEFWDCLRSPPPKNVF